MRISELRRKEFGHNLRALLAKAREQGLEGHIDIENIEIGVIDLLSYDYAEKRLEYRVTKGTYYLPLLPDVWGVARKLAYDLESVWGSGVGA